MSQAASRLVKLEKWEKSEDWVQKPPTPTKPLRFRFPDPPRLGNSEAVAEIRGLCCYVDAYFCIHFNVCVCVYKCVYMYVCMCVCVFFFIRVS
jgi:hypothetical protein